jgi:hypothetical protein
MDEEELLAALWPRFKRGMWRTTSVCSISKFTNEIRYLSLGPFPIPHGSGATSRRVFAVESPLAKMCASSFSHLFLAPLDIYNSAHSAAHILGCSLIRALSIVAARKGPPARDSLNSASTRARSPAVLRRRQRAPSKLGGQGRAPIPSCSAVYYLAYLISYHLGKYTFQRKALELMMNQSIQQQICRGGITHTGRSHGEACE